MNWFRDKLSFASRMSFYVWRLFGNRYEAIFKMQTGFKVILRPNPFQDVAIATEVFATEVYDPPAAVKLENAQYIVDLGANVGYSCVYWLSKYPQARVVAFEPHPDHVAQVRKHITANSASTKITLVPKGASIEHKKLYLTDQEFLSELVEAPTVGTLEVEVVDWIAEIENRQIDLLKIDIEGYEYEILSDVRFGQLNIRCCVLEWHNTDQYPEGRAWCKRRLEDLNYEVTSGKMDASATGLLWAWKDDKS